MKKLLLSLVAVVLLTSCSNDDTANNIASSSRYTVTQKSYDSGSIENINVFEYTNGKPTMGTFYTPNHIPLSNAIMNYTDGVITSSIIYTGNNIEIGRTNFTYDAQGRITKKVTQEGSYVSTTNYTYNSNNTITSVTTGSNTSTKTFYLNSTGIIYKQEEGSNVYELIFNGTNPISAIYNGSTKTFTYDDNHDTSLIRSNTFGSYLPNAVLAGNYLQDAETVLATKYVLTETSSGEVIRNVYVFNAEGKPTNIKRYSNDVLVSDSDYSYE